MVSFPIGAVILTVPALNRRAQWTRRDWQSGRHTRSDSDSSFEQPFDKVRAVSGLLQPVDALMD